jgi:hypothetical protein
MRWNWKIGLAVLGLALVAVSVAVAQVTWPYSTYLPIVRKDPSPTPTVTPTRTPTPPPTSTSVPVYIKNGIRGDYFRVLNTVAAPNQDVWFEGSNMFSLITPRRSICAC